MGMVVAAGSSTAVDVGGPRTGQPPVTGPLDEGVA
jgi:hypothetical protein